MDNEVLRRYARLIAVKGGGILPGQSVVITAGLDQPEFVLMLAEECYAAGAAEVEVDWGYPPLEKLALERESVETLGAVKPWQERRLRYRADTLPVMIYLESDDPDGLAGADHAKRARVQQLRYKVTKPIRDEMENRYQWSIAAVPGLKWARKVFPRPGGRRGGGGRSGAPSWPARARWRATPARTGRGTTPSSRTAAAG